MDAPSATEMQQILFTKTQMDREKALILMHYFCDHTLDPSGPFMYVLFIHQKMPPKEICEPTTTIEWVFSQFGLAKQPDLPLRALST